MSDGATGSPWIVIPEGKVVTSQADLKLMQEMATNPYAAEADRPSKGSKLTLLRSADGRRLVVQTTDGQEAGQGSERLLASANAVTTNGMVVFGTSDPQVAASASEAVATGDASGAFIEEAIIDLDAVRQLYAVAYEINGQRVLLSVMEAPATYVEIIAVQNSAEESASPRASGSALTVNEDVASAIWVPAPDYVAVIDGPGMSIDEANSLRGSTVAVPVEEWLAQGR